MPHDVSKYAWELGPSQRPSRSLGPVTSPVLPYTKREYILISLLHA
ncbi:hypothetical protein CGRA01v4_13352 [Colletotrichum graminicola]|nr:hypothetical protein CGRA01v4_13352 [Colletotrichum graminicola]